MKMLTDLFSTDYGLMSIAVIAFMLVMAAWFAAFFRRKMNEDAESSSLDALKKGGMQAVEKPDIESFSKIVTEEVRKEFVAKYGSDVLDAILKAS